MTIQFVVPERREGGVYDFSTLLAGALRDRGEEVELVHLDASSALSWRPSERVVVQYSGYGFAKRGAPLWLLATLATKRRQIRRLGVFFHELYAEGPPSSSAFWLSPAQKGVARGLAELCDFWMTSREDSATWLRQYAASKPHSVLPVFSTIGETADLPQERERALVVFGTSGLRERAYRQAGTKLFDWAEQAGILVIDIGSPIRDATLRAEAIRRGAELRGTLPAHEIRRILSTSRYGLISYPLDYIAKSSVFAAYAAHRVCPIVIWSNYSAHDGLTSGVHYMGGNHLSESGPDPARVSDAVRSWYRSHDLEKHAWTVLTRLVDGSIDDPAGGLISDAHALWSRRERPTDLVRAATVWVKRGFHARNIAKVLWTSERLRASGARVGSLVVVGHAKIEGDLGKLHIGDESSLGRCELAVHDQLRIGRRVVLNDGAIVLTASHALSDPGWPTKTAPVLIDDYAWIATNAIVLPGSRIGRGAVVGAGAVVRGDVPPGAVVVGNPALPTGRIRSEHLDYSPVLRNAPFEAWVGPPRVPKA